MGRILDENGKSLPVNGFVSRVIDTDGTARLYVGADGLIMLETNDGIHFRQTDVKIDGGIFPTIFLDPHESDPAKKYKIFRLETKQPFDPVTDGVFAYTSPDGITFTKVDRVLPFYTDNPTIVNWDERLGKYIIYLRAFDYGSENQRRVGRIEVNDPLKPWPYQKTDHDRLFPSIENLTVVLSADAANDPHSDLYYNAATFYPTAEEVYLMFTAPFRHFDPKRHPFVKPPHAGQWEDFGMLEIQLAVSRDGVSWNRPSREPYFPTGLADEWDRWYAVMAPGMVIRGNYIYQYYNSTGRLHDSAFLRAEYERVDGLGGIGIVRQRLDGFMSADAGFKGGWLETPLITFSGTSVRLNIDTGSTGTAFVEIRDAAGHAIPGFSLDECEEIGGNFIDQQVYWKGSSDLSSLVGKPVKLFIKMKRAKLYSFIFRND